MKKSWTRVSNDNHELMNTLEHASEDLRNDEDVVMAAVREDPAFMRVLEMDGMALEFAGEALRSDKGVVMAAVKKSGMALGFAGEALRSDKGVVMAAVENDWRALRYAKGGMEDDRDVVLKAVEQYGNALEFAGNIMRNDEEVVKTAVENEWRALKYVDWQAIRFVEIKDLDIMMLAIRSDPLAFQYAGDKMKNDKDIIMEALRRDGRVFRHAGESMKKNRDVVLLAVEKDWQNLRFAEGSTINDKDVVLKAVQQNWHALEYAGDDMRNNKEVVTTAVQKNGMALLFAGDDMRNDKDVVLKAVEKSPLALKYALKDAKNDKQVVSKAVEQDWRALQHAGDDMRNDRDVLKIAMQQDWHALQYGGEVIKNDKDAMMRAIESEWWYISKVGDDIKYDNSLNTVAMHNFMESCSSEDIWGKDIASRWKEEWGMQCVEATRKKNWHEATASSEHLQPFSFWDRVLASLIFHPRGIPQKIKDSIDAKKVEFTSKDNLKFEMSFLHVDACWGEIVVAKLFQTCMGKVLYNEPPALMIASNDSFLVNCTSKGNFAAIKDAMPDVRLGQLYLFGLAHHVGTLYLQQKQNSKCKYVNVLIAVNWSLYDEFYDSLVEHYPDVVFRVKKSKTMRKVVEYIGKDKKLKDVQGFIWDSELIFRETEYILSVRIDRPYSGTPIRTRRSSEAEKQKRESVELAHEKLVRQSDGRLKRAKTT